MRPYFLYGVILLAFKIAKDIISGVLYKPKYDTVLNTLFITRKSFISELWFLPCLFIAHCLIYELMKIKRKEFMWCVALILAWLTLFFRTNFNFAFPMNIDNALVAIPFIILGMEWRNLENNHKQQFMKNELMISSVVLIAFIGMCVYENIYSDSIIYFADLVIENVFVFVCTAITGTAMVTLIAQSALKSINVIFEKLGENSITIYGMHYCILAVVFQLFKHFVPNIFFLGGREIRLISIVIETIIVIGVIIILKNIYIKLKK